MLYFLENTFTILFQSFIAVQLQLFTTLTSKEFYITNFLFYINLSGISLLSVRISFTGAIFVGLETDSFMKQILINLCSVTLIHINGKQFEY